MDPRIPAPCRRLSYLLFLTAGLCACSNHANGSGSVIITDLSVTDGHLESEWEARTATWVNQVEEFDFWAFDMEGGKLFNYGPAVLDPLTMSTAEYDCGTDSEVARSSALVDAAEATGADPEQGVPLSEICGAVTTYMEDLAADWRDPGEHSTLGVGSETFLETPASDGSVPAYGYLAWRSGSTSKADSWDASACAFVASESDHESSIHWIENGTLTIVLTDDAATGTFTGELTPEDGASGTLEATFDAVRCDAAVGPMVF